MTSTTSLAEDSDRWVVDFGNAFQANEAALYEQPFKVVIDSVVPFRNDPAKCRSTEGRLRSRYWEFQRPRPELRQALNGKSRFIVTPESSEHRLFIWVPKGVLIQGSLFAVCSDSDTTFGILSSAAHEIWSTAQGNRLGVGNQRRYNIGVTFETFPFPDGISPRGSSSEHGASPVARRIALAAQELDRLRRYWLNPPDMVKPAPELVEAFPARLTPVNDSAAMLLKTRTLTNLYNKRPTWLSNAHAELDTAVAAAYGWASDTPPCEVLRRLLDLNLARLT